MDYLFFLQLSSNLYFNFEIRPKLQKFQRVSAKQIIKKTIFKYSFVSVQADFHIIVVGYVDSK